MHLDYVHFFTKDYVFVSVTSTVIIRPPDSNLNEFLSDLNHVLEKITKKNKLVFLMGDWNLNLINHHCHKVTSEILDLLYSRMFFPLITRPTRPDSRLLQFKLRRL